MSIVSARSKEKLFKKVEKLGAYIVRWYYSKRVNKFFAEVL